MAKKAQRARRKADPVPRVFFRIRPDCDDPADELILWTDGEWHDKNGDQIEMSMDAMAVLIKHGHWKEQSR